MKRVVFLAACGAILISLPLAGIWMSSGEMTAFLEFPPRTRFVEHAPFSLPVFIGLAIVILATILPFLIRIGRSRLTEPKTAPAKPFPWWGWLALGCGLLFWTLAWSRFTWFAPMQLYTFTPLWIAYIVTTNALTVRRTGRCLLTHQTNRFLGLFPVSAAFWWFFEYLNRFVQNWHYVAADHLGAWPYFLVATLSFSTVLPAVLSTEELIAANPRNTAGLNDFIPIHINKPAAWMILIAAGAGLFFIGRKPDLLFPLLWIAPLLFLIAVSDRTHLPTVFSNLETGDWRRAYRFCLAALICGFFWEMWNMYSLAKWVYAVPFVNRFHIFEMPLLGYAGYLPFGLECAGIVALFMTRQK